MPAKKAAAKPKPDLVDELAAEATLDRPAVEGIVLALAEARAGYLLRTNIPPALAGAMVRRGLAGKQPGRLYLTEAGVDLAEALR